jgi:hypothetical protein
MLVSDTRFVSGPSSALTNLAGALHDAAVGSTVFFGHAFELEIPADNSSHLCLGARISLKLGVEREEFREAIADFGGIGGSAAASRYHFVVESRNQFREKRTIAK